jgi:DNA adenine methylase
VVYLNTPGYSSYLLADVNRDLIDLYGHIRADAMAVATLVTELFGLPGENTPARYYEMREDFNTCPDGTLRRSALFVFLNRFGFNGMCRYNKSGLFNVPHGQSKTILNPTEAILAMGRTLLERPAQLICSDFRPLLALAGEGDTVYLDPPFLPLSATSNFTAYHSDGFTSADQTDLAALSRQAAFRGALVLVSNHDTEFARQLYAGASLVELQVLRSVGANARSRKRVGELLAVFGQGYGNEAGVVRLASA